VESGLIPGLQFLPKGRVVAVVDVKDCVSTLKLCGVRGQYPVRGMEFVCGNYDLGRYAWITENCRALKVPVPVKGRQGFFNLPAAVEAKVREQL
jgi:hypothetical protein